MLENSVASVKPLRAVKYEAYQLFNHTCKLLDYDQHATLLLSAETNYDSQSVSTSSRSTRQVYSTELEDSFFVIDSTSTVTEEVDYDIDTSTTTLLTNVTNSGNYNHDSYFLSEDYSSLTPEERDLWRKFHQT